LQLGDEIDIDVHPQPGGDLTVVVREEGEPVPGIPLRVLDSNGEEADQFQFLITEQPPITDELGKWQWMSLPVGDYEITTTPDSVVVFEVNATVAQGRENLVFVDVGGE